MSVLTFQTRAPEELRPFIEEMAALYCVIERSLYRDLMKGEEPLKEIKKRYLIDWGINGRQFNSLHAGLKGKIASRKEARKRQITQLTDAIAGIQKSIKKKERRLKKLESACGLKGKKSPRAQLQWEVHQKKRRLSCKQDRLVRLRGKEPTLIFGGKKLWHAQYDLEANGYNTHEEWLVDWHSARLAQFSVVGCRTEKAGCANCQLTTDGDITISVPYRLQSEFGTKVTASGIKFAYGQEYINAALAPKTYYQGQKKKQAINGATSPLTYRFVKKLGNVWYIFCTVDVPEIPYQTSKGNGALGIDLNPGVIGWAYCDAEGNLLAFGQIRINLAGRSTNQTTATLGDACRELAELAERYKCPIVIERLDFSKKKASMKEQGVRYSRMLSNFAYSKFSEILSSRCSKQGIELTEVNPAYSSLIGLTKFMTMYGLSSDTAAGLVLARRALRKSERLTGLFPDKESTDMMSAKSALGKPEDFSRHVWSNWRQIARKTNGISRHRFFASRVANSEMEATQFGESAEAEGSSCKQDALPLSGRDSRPRIVENVARSASYQQLTLFDLNRCGKV